MSKLNSKKGVIRVLESIIAVLILLAVVLMIFNRQPPKVDFASSIYKIENQILKEISDSTELRTSVLTNDNLAINDFVRSRIKEFNLEFNTSIKNPEEAIFCDAPFDKEVYTVDTIISTNITEKSFNPQKFLLCVWVK